MTPVSARSRLIVALDLPDVEDARAMTRMLGPSVEFYKIGMELCYSGAGLSFARELIDQGRRVFIDLKLHDIGATVEAATHQIAQTGAHFLTIHGFPQTMRAARAGAADSSLQLLAITVLTSYDDVDLREAGYAISAADLVAHRAVQAQESGVDGLVLSPLELNRIRALVGPKMLLVAPGVRPLGTEINDQKRVMTPHEAMAAGADYLVVGRPVTRAPDPRGAAEAIVAEIESAQKSTAQG